MAITVLNLINGALRLLGVLSSGEVAEATEALDALVALNDMLDTWATQSLLVYGSLPQTFALVPGQKVYTLGTGGNWNMPRPVLIDSMYLQYTSTNPAPLNLPMNIVNLDDYNRLIVPNTPSPIPTVAYIDDSFPLRNVYLWPVPSAVYSVNLFTGALIPAFLAVTQLVALPAGYSELLRYNLALRLAPEYGVQPSPVVAAGALASIAAVKRNNIKPLYMACDGALVGSRGGFNYLIGE